MSLTIAQIEPARDNFYAPAFDVAVSGRSLVRDLRLEVVSVQVEQVLEGADRCTFVLNNAFDITRRDFIKVGDAPLPEFFAFGAQIEIRVGYGDRAGLTLVFAGLITEFATSFPSSGLPQVTISGYDHAYRLTKGAQSKNWEGKKDSDVARQVAQDYNLEPHVEDTRVVHPKIERSQENAWQFLARLARRNGFEFFVVQKALFFRSPANDKQGDIELAWGRGLVSFSPEINLSQQVTQVEVHGWNIQTKQPIVGRARKGDEPGRDRARPSGRTRASGAEYLQKVVKKDEGVLRVREPVFSQQQADQYARALLKRRAEGFVGGRGESIGIPEITPNANVTLRGLGDLFNTTFYVHQATHTVDSSGYRTTFQVKDTTI
jgi:phage protein D